MIPSIQKYLNYIQDINADNVSNLRDYCAPTVHFRDPFNDVTGVEKYISIMEETFESFSDIQMDILETAWSDEGAFIKWNFYFRLGKGEIESITGVSEICVNDKEQIVAHLDYWDAGERIYAKIPILGAAVRFARGKISAGLDG